MSTTSIASYEEAVATHEWHVPEHYNIAEDVCDKHPADKLAMIHEHFDGTVRRVQWGELQELSNRFANVLRVHGVQKGDRVAMLLPPTPETAAAFFGTWKTGAILLSMSVLYGDDGIRHRVSDSQAKLLVTNAANRDRVDPSLVEHVLILDDDLLQSGDASFEREDTLAEDPAQLYYTSGTTGLAKGIVHAHRYLLAHEEFVYCHDVRDGEVFHGMGEWAWAAGIAPLLGPWRFGAVQLVYQREGGFDPHKQLAVLSRHQATNVFTTPTAMRSMMAIGDAGTRYPQKFRIVCSAGEPLNPEAIRWFREQYGLTVLDYYGLTESYPLCANYPFMDVREGSMGRPMPGWDVQILDPDEQPVPQGERGEICLRARSNPHYPLGYWGNEEAAKETFGGDWFHTKDAARFDEDGYVWYEGRADDVIIAAGYRIGPFEVESACLEHAAVKEAAAVASPDERRGSVVKAFIVLAEGHEGSDELIKEIQDHVRSRLSAYAYPRKIEFVDDLPKTLTGKIRRIELRQREADRRVKRPRARALLPQSVARLVGLAALASVGALEWQRLVGTLSSVRALVWVAVAVAAGAAVLAADRVPRSRASALVLPAIVVASLLVGYLLSGAGLGLLRPRHWDELAVGLVDGLQALGTVRLPYVGVDPWPRIVLELLGAELLILAGLLTFWPRVPSTTDARVPYVPPERGYPFVALAVLLVVVASPVVSLGGTRSLVLGLTLAALTVVFLWLERLPLKPGLGVAALLAIALAGALPLAAVADRGQPWFDYRSFAEGLGPDDPVRFSWTQSYGPIDWPRDGNEVMRITSSQPQYWKARNLDTFDNYAWKVRSDATNGLGEGPEPDLPEDWEGRPAWTTTIAVSVRRMRGTDVIGAGTTLDVTDSSRNVRPALSAGTWDAPGALRRGDSYTAEVHVPKPPPGELEEATSGARERQDGQRVITVPFQPGRSAPSFEGGMSDPTPVTEAEVHFAAWDGDGGSFATYPTAQRSERDIDTVMERSEYARTWLLSKQLKQGTETAMDYVRAVNEYLHQPEFRYTERPPQPDFGRPALDFFLNDSHQGYCQHFAGAMALLLRMGGLSARVATGFSPGGYSSRRKAWVVRDTDAHAWVEVWFDDYGWVTIDPTPDATPARSQIAVLRSLPFAAPLSPDRDPDGADAGDGNAPPISLRPELRLGVDQEGGTSAAGDGGLGRWAWVGGGLLVVGLGFALLLFVRRPRGATPMDRAIAEVEDALRRVGRPVSTGTTMTQLERRLGSHSPEVSAYLRALAAGRYAARTEPLPRTGRRALRRALAQGLGFGARTRALWALPPRFERGPRTRTRTFEVETSVRS